jgi:hypothetical protein
MFADLSHIYCYLNLYIMRETLKYSGLVTINVTVSHNK